MMRVLNLGCGAKISRDPDVVNIDWSYMLRAKQGAVLSRVVPLFLSDSRRRRFAAIGENVLVHDLSKGIPAESGTVDVVYHSHVLEHLDRDIVPVFLREVVRVLKPGGLHRIVVPDLEALCLAYLESNRKWRSTPGSAAEHDATVAAMYEQSVRKETEGARQQPPLRRKLENLFFGDARKRGETHQWMYDRVNLAHLLLESGLVNPQVLSFDVSSISHWKKYGLDADAEGREVRSDSLYMEAQKPLTGAA
jgi:predicted SAM-dependent methyltransferase